MPPNNKLKPTLERIRTLAEGMKVDCPQCVGYTITVGTLCATCLMPPRTGTVHDPAMIPLLDLVRDGCSSCPDCPPKVGELQVSIGGLTTKPFESWLTDSDEDLEQLYVRSCHGTGYVTTDDWDNLRAKGRIGAFAGAIDWCLADTIELSEHNLHRLTVDLGAVIMGEDPDHAAAEALEAWLKERK